MTATTTYDSGEMYSALRGAHVLVLSPHPEDALFSAYALISQAANAASCTEVWTVFAGIPDTPEPTVWDLPRWHGDVQQLIRDRREKAEQAFAHLPAVNTVHLNLVERAYATPARRATDISTLHRHLEEWTRRTPDGPRIIVLPVGAGTRKKPGMIDRLRSLTRHRGRRLSRERTASMPRTLKARASATNTPAPQAPLSHLPVEPRGPIARWWVRRRASTIAATSIRAAQQILHAGFKRRRRAAQTSGMLANEDHIAVRDAVVAWRNAHQDRSTVCELWFYEELPYLWGEPGDRAARELGATYGLLVPCETLVNRPAKATAIAEHHTQIALMDPVKRRLEFSDRLPPTERIWTPWRTTERIQEALRTFTSDITVVIPAYNASTTIGLQLEALARQADAPRFDVVIVDNGSTDDLASAVAPYKGKVQVRVVRAVERQGASYARNVGLVHATGPLVAACDADDVISQFWLRDMLAAIADADLISGSARWTPDSSFTSVDSIWEDLDLEETGRAPAPQTIDADYPILMGGDCVMRVAAARALGGFDQSFVRGSEDVDFALRAVKAGLRVKTTPGARIAYRARPTSRSAVIREVRRAFMHTRLAERHGLWNTSPNLPRGWPLELPKAVAVGGLVLAGRRTGDMRIIAARAGMGSGLLAGFVWHRLLRRGARAQLGTGFSHVRKSEAA